MPERKCPICEMVTSDEVIIQIEGREPVKSELCPECHRHRFYFDDTKEIRYRLEGILRIAKIKDMFDGDYVVELHTPMVLQMLRCEIMMDYYEWRISNNLETTLIIELLGKERNHWRHLADKLHITLRAIKGDTSNIKHDFGDFKEYMAEMLKGLNVE